MANTLIIKGADFSANYVAQVSFETVPCTDIEFDQSTYSISGYNSVEVEYTLTPSNTTDAVSWTSSDTSVVTISNGVMTIQGIGTATITATCGEQTATATVTVDISYIPDWKSVYISNSNDGYVTSSANLSKETACGTGAQATNYQTAESSGDPQNLIKLPNNTVKVKISIPDSKKELFLYNTRTYIVWAADELVIYGIRHISTETSYNIRSNIEKTFDVPSGANAFSFTTQLATDPTASDDLNEIMEGTGLEIKFLNS